MKKEEIVKKTLNSRYGKVCSEEVMYHLFKEDPLMTYFKTNSIKEAKKAMHRQDKHFKETKNRVKRILKGKK